MCKERYFSFDRFENEAFFCGTSAEKDSFAEEVRDLLGLALNRAPEGSLPVWLRFHISDPANQESILLRTVQEFSLPAAVAVVGQAPCGGAHAALEAYFLSGAAVERREAGCTEVSVGSYRQLFFNTADCRCSGSADQMHAEFAAAEKILAARGGTVAENLHRTWIYCRDIDNQYAGLVKARKDYFDRNGLTADTHYIASTGIEGICGNPSRIVRMDSFALFGNRPEQICYLHAPEMLSPTHIYGVTFERGTRIIYGDRSCYYISGTASIDKEGQVLHVGDVIRQTERLLENVAALLESGGGTLDDLRQAVIYLRDPADAPKVKKVLDAALPAHTARLMVRGSVCRPSWLVEMDAVAVNSCGDPEFGKMR